MAQLSPAIITAISTIIGAVISAFVALVVSNKQNDKTMALVLYRLEQLEAKVDKHNNLVERMSVVEEKLKLLEK